MAVITEGIVKNNNGTISFGNYEVNEKLKINDFDVDGDLYNLKTHNQVTRLTKNETLLFESVPGATVHNFQVTGKKTVFSIEGKSDVQITMELLPSTEYKVILDEFVIGSAKSSIAGKFTFSIALNNCTGNVEIDTI